MSRITLLGGSTDRFVLADGTEGYLEVKKEPTEKQAEKGTPIAVVFVPAVQEPAPELSEPGHEVTAAHPDFRQPLNAEDQAELDEKNAKRDASARERADKKAAKELADVRVAEDKRVADARREELADQPAAKAKGH